jgi:MYXO-CTERM domain-containing protein
MKQVFGQAVRHVLIVGLALAAAAAGAAPFSAIQGPKGDLTSPTVPTFTVPMQTAVASFNAAMSPVATQTFESGSPAFAYTLNGAQSAAFSPALNGSLRLFDGENCVGACSFTVGRYNVTPGLPLIDPMDPLSRQDHGKWLDTSVSFQYAFSAAVSAIGFFVTDVGDYDGILSLNLLRNGQSVYQAVVYQGLGNFQPPGLNNGNLLFYGVALGTEFDTAQFSVTQAFCPPSTSCGSDFLGFDQITIGLTNPVPVPTGGTWALAALGLGLLGVRRRR